MKKIIKDKIIKEPELKEKDESIRYVNPNNFAGDVKKDNYDNKEKDFSCVSPFKENYETPNDDGKNGDGKKVQSVNDNRKTDINILEVSIDESQKCGV